MPPQRFLTADEATALLGVRKQTLYAYVSRGLIRSEQAEGAVQSRRYYAEDVARLKDRKALRRDPGQAAERALNWGTPVLESAVTAIGETTHYYRGHDAIALARDASLEQVAGLIWADHLPSAPYAWDASDPALTTAVEAALAQLPKGLSPAERFQAVLLLVEAEDAAAYDLRPEGVRRSGERILRTLVHAAVDGAQWEGSIARTLQRAWTPDRPEAASLLSAALVLCADHELNVSAFTARCVASAHSSPYQVVVAALAALQGQRHGGHTARVEALLREMPTPGDVRRVLTDRLRRGESIPGFGHPLYPNGDPRAIALLETTADAVPDAPAVALSKRLVGEAKALMNEHPTVDTALVVLARALGLPSGHALAIFAIGRTVGWLGHALEQYASGALIRPRARYAGPAPHTA